MIRTIRNFFLSNWELKLFSLILAFVLWLVLIPEEKLSADKTLAVPLEPQNIPQGLELVDKPPSTIDVVVRAPKRLIDKITPGNVVAKLNLEKATVFQEEYPLNREMISVPSGAAVVDVNPNKVYLKLERTRIARLEILPNIIGELSKGLKLEKIEVIPPSVEVIGAESKLHDTDRVRTTPINISGITKTTEFETDLILPNPDLRTTASPARVKVRVVIQGEILEEQQNQGRGNKRISS